MSSNKPESERDLYERIMQGPGELWRVIIVLKELPDPTGKFGPMEIVAGVEADRAVSRESMISILEAATDSVTKAKQFLVEASEEKK